jgi:transposase
MRQKSQTRQTGAAKAIKAIRRATRKQYSAEEKIRIVLDGLRGEETIAELCRREGIAQSIYYKWSKEFLEAGKRRLADDTSRPASTGEVTAFRLSPLAKNPVPLSIGRSLREDHGLHTTFLSSGMVRS